MNYKESYVTNLIRERARARAESAGGSFSNVGCPKPTVRFTEWLYYEQGVVNFRELRKYELWNFYLDYRVDCVRMGLMFESGEVYGLDNV